MRDNTQLEHSGHTSSLPPKCKSQSAFRGFSNLRTQEQPGTDIQGSHQHMTFPKAQSGKSHGASLVPATVAKVATYETSIPCGGRSTPKPAAC